MQIELTQADIMQLEVIKMDQDKEEAYKFISERIMPQVQKLQGMRMHSHLDGGKGSAF